jgi:hypothetical protein
MAQSKFHNKLGARLYCIACRYIASRPAETTTFSKAFSGSSKNRCWCLSLRVFRSRTRPQARPTSQNTLTSRLNRPVTDFVFVAHRITSAFGSLKVCSRAKKTHPRTINCRYQNRRPRAYQLNADMQMRQICDLQKMMYEVSAHRSGWKCSDWETSVTEHCAQMSLIACDCAEEKQIQE